MTTNTWNKLSSCFIFQSTTKQNKNKKKSPSQSQEGYFCHANETVLKNVFFFFMSMHCFMFYVFGVFIKLLCKNCSNCRKAELFHFNINS